MRTLRGRFHLLLPKSILCLLAFSLTIGCDSAPEMAQSVPDKTAGDTSADGSMEAPVDQLEPGGEFGNGEMPTDRSLGDKMAIDQIFGSSNSGQQDFSPVGSDSNSWPAPDQAQSAQASQGYDGTRGFEIPNQYENHASSGGYTIPDQTTPTQSMPVQTPRSYGAPMEYAYEQNSEDTTANELPLELHPPMSSGAAANVGSSSESLNETRSDIADSSSKTDENENPNFASVDVFYATDRNRIHLVKSSMFPFQLGLGLTVGMLICAIALLIFNRMRYSIGIAILAGVVFGVLNHYHGKTAMRDGLAYGTKRGELVKGVANVTIPKNHTRGIVERPSILRLEFEEDQNKHVVLTKARELEPDEFYSQMNQQLAGADDQDLLVFIHGYNVDFDSAVRRTAQICHDLEFDCVPVCYSWPSQGTIPGYKVDENNVSWSTPHLRDFLLEIAQRSNAKSINVLAHSMGNRAMTSALSQLSDRLPPNQLPLFNSVILAAPDVDAATFRDDLAPRLANVGHHVTLYASSHDRALEASRALHGGYPRAGESGDGLVVIEEIETVDVSGVDLSLLGHSYYKVKPILEDIYQVVRKRLPASKREGLVSKLQRNSIYWHLPVPLVGESESPTRR